MMKLSHDILADTTPRFCSLRRYLAAQLNQHEKFCYFVIYIISFFLILAKI